MHETKATIGYKVSWVIQQVSYGYLGVYQGTENISSDPHPLSIQPETVHQQDSPQVALVTLIFKGFTRYPVDKNHLENMINIELPRLIP